MRKQLFRGRLHNTTSMLALSAAALLASSGTPATAQINKGLYAAGSTLAAKTFREIFDCYKGIGLPSGCAVSPVAVQGMVANIGSGNGMRGYLANKPDLWYGGTVTPNPSINILIPTPFPALQPPYVDSLNPNFGTYPYPRVDIGLSEAPLPATPVALTTTSVGFNPITGWRTPSGALTQITLNAGSQITTYSATTYGKPIQIPAYEANLAIPVNVNSTSFQINSQIRPGGNIVPGGAIQLTAGQLCAIFSGIVTDWNSPNFIPYLDAAGVVQVAPFYYANVGNGVGVAQAYANASLPLRLVYQAGDSGETFMLTNYLKAVCPLLDPNNNVGYQSVFASGARPLPSTRFSDLIINIQNVRGLGPWTPGSSLPGAWIAAAGSDGAAAAISDGPGTAGNMGYAGANFTRPYATTVGGVSAPHVAALQNENLRISGISVPNAVSGTSLTFIAPTPIAADAAWSDTRLQTPSLSWSWADYNIYGNTFTAPTLQGGVSLFGQPVLPLTNVAGAYPLSGATFMEMYSCYNVLMDANRVTNLRNFLTWYVNGPSSAQQVVESNGFHLMPSNYAGNIRVQYLTLTQPGYIFAASAVNTRGCTGVAGGLAGGAK